MFIKHFTIGSLSYLRTEKGTLLLPIANFIGQLTRIIVTPFIVIPSLTLNLYLVASRFTRLAPLGYSKQNLLRRALVYFKCSIALLPLIAKASTQARPLAPFNYLFKSQSLLLYIALFINLQQLSLLALVTTSFLILLSQRLFSLALLLLLFSYALRALFAQYIASATSLFH